MPTTIIEGSKDESKKRQKRRKEEVITSPLPLGEEVNNSPIISDLSEVEIEDEDISPEENRRIVKALELQWAKEEALREEALREEQEKVDTTDYSKIEIVPIEQLKASPKQILQKRQSNPTQIDYFTLNEVKDFFMEVFGKAGRETASKILTKYGVDKVSLLSEDNRQRVAVDCLEYLAAIDANSSR